MVKSARNKSDQESKDAPTSSKGYVSYVHKVLRRLHASKKDGGEGIGVSSQAVLVVDKLVQHLEERMSTSAIRVARIAKKKTLSAPHVRTATMLALTPKTGAVAMQQADDALKQFTGAA